MVHQCVYQWSLPMLNDSEKNKLKELGFDLDGLDEVTQSFAGEAHQEPVPKEEKITSEPRIHLDDMLKACTDKDHWKVGQDMHFRAHVIPRRYMYEPVPHDFPGDLNEIGYTRETHRFFEDGSHDVVHDEWGMIPEASGMTNLAWTGFSLFRKRSYQTCRSHHKTLRSTGLSSLRDSARGWSNKLARNCAR